MKDICGMNYNGVKPRPTYDKIIISEAYPVKYPDRSATFTKDAPLLTQFDGIRMLEFEKQEQTEIVKILNEDMIKKIATTTEQNAQMPRAMNRKRFDL